MSPHRARNNSLLTLLSALLLLVGIPLAGANTEKAIFLAPEAIHFPETTPSLDNLRLHTITHTRSSIRTSISVEFPAGEDDINGAESWYLLRTLKEGQRYEVRVCWAATVRFYSLSSTILPNAVTDTLPSNRPISNSRFSISRRLSIRQSWCRV